MPRHSRNFRTHVNERKNDGQVIDRSRRFQEACELMRKNAAKILNDEKLESSSSEEELDDSAILQKTLSQYSDGDEQNLMKTREYLQDILTSGALVCLICIESIKRNDKTWSCEHCYGIFHLYCIQKWAKDSLYNLSTENESRKEWCCPKCRGEYTPSEQPQKYMCFCEKVENPIFDLWTVPHSCGRICEKRLKPDCSHTCSLLCHPGPCPPCPQTISITCCCGKSKPASRRCSNKEWSCGKKCEKALSCKLHFCEDICHKDSCSPCKKQSKQKCMCGNETKLQPCENPVWQCDKICMKPLECGNHSCQIICHEGLCPTCPDSGPRTCPCSKKVMSLPCTEKVMPCGDTCNKRLECGLHSCSQRCHFGPCEKCLQMRLMKCRCGQREKSVPCCKEYICDNKCKRLRDCHKHFCNRKCCIGQCPPCELPCGKSLNCGCHKCLSICHQGPCYPCKEKITITCNCGISKVTVPCGRKKSAVPPKCSANCRLPSDCHHPERHKHKCHFGTCPPCKLVCNKDLACEHKCPMKCHSAVLTKIEMKEKKDGPWDLINSYKTELVEIPCPPCMAPVPVICVGGHEIVNLPCWEARPRSCGRPCGRKLMCGNHTCQIECHEVSCNADNNLQSQECEPCEELCQKPRKPGCNHPCLKQCHPGECSPCQQRIKMKCHCDINALYIICSEWLDADEMKRDVLKSCTNRCPKQMLCGHRCTMICHKKDCDTGENCKKKITLRCPCKRQKKEIQCSQQLKNPLLLSCDDNCIDVQETLKAEKLECYLKLKEEERKQQEKELQEFLRKTEGKKRRKKKVVDDNENKSECTINFVISSIVSVCLAGILVFYLYK